MHPDRDTIAQLLPARRFVCLVLLYDSSGKHQDSRENKTNCFPRDHALSVYYYIGFRKGSGTWKWTEAESPGVAAATDESRCHPSAGPTVEPCRGNLVSQFRDPGALK